MGRLRGQSVEQFGRSEALVSLFDYQLPFLNHVHQLDPDQRVLGGLKRLEPEHGAGDPLHTSVVLFDHIVLHMEVAKAPVCNASMKFGRNSTTEKSFAYQIDPRHEERTCLDVGLNLQPLRGFLYPDQGLVVVLEYAPSFNTSLHVPASCAWCL